MKAFYHPSDDSYHFTREELYIVLHDTITTAVWVLLSNETTGGVWAMKKARDHIDKFADAFAGTWLELLSDPQNYPENIVDFLSFPEAFRDFIDGIDFDEGKKDN
jgi:hypothetical protein